MNTLVSQPLSEEIENNSLEVSEPKLKQLHKLLRFYWREAKRCEKVKAYLAGCVMAGAALEASLILMVTLYQDEAIATNKCPMKKNEIKPLLRWSLAELLQVAKAANWLPYGLERTDSWSHKSAKVGDYSEVVRLLRNLVHPGKYIEDNNPKRITNKHLQLSLDTYLTVNRWLLYKIENSLVNAINF